MANTSLSRALRAVENYVRSLVDGGMRIPLAIFHGPWVTGEVYLREGEAVDVPLDVLVINENGVNRVEEVEVGGYRVRARVMDVGELARRVEALDLELIDAVITGIFVVKEERFFEYFSSFFNETMRKRRLRWDPERGSWIHD